MKTLIISDTVVFSESVKESPEKTARAVVDNIKTINLLRTDGYNIVMLSNKPYKYMRPLHGNIASDGIESVFRETSCKKGDALPIRLGILGPDSSWEELMTATLRYNYSIFGAGAFTVDSKDDLVCQGPYIDSKTLRGMIRLFEERGYKSPDQEHVFDGSIDLYKFFRFDKGYTKPSGSTYGMQCSSGTLAYDIETVDEIMKRFPIIEGFVLNRKPCFYRTDNNKLDAVNRLIATGGVDPGNVQLFLGDSTEARLADAYRESTWAIGNSGVHNLARHTDRFAPTLSKALGKVA